jgi:hypothetical protein
MQPLLTLFYDTCRVFGASLLAQRCRRYVEQRARAQQGQMVWLQGVGVSQFKALEVFGQHGLSNSTTCCAAQSVFRYGRTAELARCLLAATKSLTGTWMPCWMISAQLKEMGARASFAKIVLNGCNRTLQQ